MKDNKILCQFNMPNKCFGVPPINILPFSALGTRNFEVTAKNLQFCCPVSGFAPAHKRNQISGNCFVRLKGSCREFRQTPSVRYYARDPLPVFSMSKLKSFGVAPTSRTPKMLIIQLWYACCGAIFSNPL